MKVVYLTNILNHYQKALCDEFYSILGSNFTFIATVTLPEERKKLKITNYGESTSYCVCAYQSKEKEKEAFELFKNADIAIFGMVPKRYKYFLKKRKKSNKIIFYAQERNYKSEPTLLSIFLRKIVYKFRYSIFKNNYLLCASAFASYDYSRTNTFRNKCFKWGYFPKFSYYKSKNELMNLKNKKLTILWVGRFLKWKHPEYMISVAKYLRQNDHDFKIYMIGVGEEFENIKKSVNTEMLNDCIELLGSCPPNIVRKYMLESNIYAFTSDRGEGWGVVLNEAMNSGCAVVAGSNIGSVPYLIKNNKNGFVFKNEDWEDLAKKIEYLILNPELREIFGFNAYKTLENLWNPRIAASRAIQLFEDILSGKKTLFEDGPCSKAEIIKDGWYD